MCTGRTTRLKKLLFLPLLSLFPFAPLIVSDTSIHNSGAQAWNLCFLNCFSPYQSRSLLGQNRICTNQGFTVQNNNCKSNENSKRLSLKSRIDANDHEEFTNLETFYLTKPMGLTLEEIDEGMANGVIIKDIDKNGSAGKIDAIKIGMKIAFINGEECNTCTFDDVMTKLIEAEGEIEISIEAHDPSPPAVSWSSPSSEDATLLFCDYYDCTENGGFKTFQTARKFCPESVKIGTVACLKACKNGPNVSARSSAGRQTFRKVKSEADLKRILSEAFQMYPQAEL